MSNAEIARLVDALTPEYYQIWEDVCNIESPSASKEGVDAVGRFFAEKARQKGWQRFAIRRFPVTLFASP